MSKIHLAAANFDDLTARLINEAMQADHRQLAIFHRLTGSPPPSRRDAAGWQRLRDRYEPIAGRPLPTPGEVVDFVISLADELDAEAARRNGVESNVAKSPDEAGVNVGKSDVGESGDAPAPPAGRLGKQALALAALAEHPDWTDEEIARAAGCHVKSLYRWKTYITAREAIRRGRGGLPRGGKAPGAGLEAWSDAD